MAAGTVSWRGLSLTDAVRLEGRRVVRDSVTFAYPGVQGVEKVDKGFRGRIMAYVGQLAAADMAALDAAIAAWEEWVGRETGTLSEAGSYDFCELTDFRVLRRSLGTGGRRAVVVATFTQLRPNSNGDEDF